MTKSEMLAKMLERSGWTITTEKDEDGYIICRPAESDDEE